MSHPQPARRTRPAPHDAHVGAWQAWLTAYLMRRSRRDEDGCWLWLGACNLRGSTGIPMMGLRGAQGKTVSVRRVAARVAGRAVGAGQKVDAACGKRLCVRPDCMRPLSPRQIVRLAVQRGAIKTGQTTSARKLAAARALPHVKVDWPTVRAMRARYQDLGDAKAVGAEFGLRPDHAHRICTHRLWREPSPFAL